MDEGELAQLRRYYRAAVVDAEEHAAWLWRVTCAVILVAMLPLGALAAVAGACYGVAAFVVVAAVALVRQPVMRRLHTRLLDLRLCAHTPLDGAVWERLGHLRPLAPTLQLQVDHLVGTYLHWIRRTAGTDEPRAQQARDQLLAVLDVAEAAGRLRRAFDPDGPQDVARHNELQRLLDDQSIALQESVALFDHTWEEARVEPLRRPGPSLTAVNGGSPGR